MPYITCFDLERAGIWNTANCCDSCHEDAECYGYDLVPPEWPGVDGGICCAAALQIDWSRPIPPQLLAARP